ncbi:MAG: hypothetical protein BGO01_18260 [Armatimonadetes bacterium 55-13]|nr:MAG: hypothetical protein BGO01_18260 [Armatimonadetes bacterium 55-13]
MRRSIYIDDRADRNLNGSIDQKSPCLGGSFAPASYLELLGEVLRPTSRTRVALTMPFFTRGLLVFGHPLGDLFPHGAGPCLADYTDHHGFSDARGAGSHQNLITPLKEVFH